MNFLLNILFVLPALALLSGVSDQPQDVIHDPAVDSTSFSVTTVAAHLDVPWEIAWGPDNWIWFTEQSGTVSKVNPETGEQKLILRLIPDVHRNRTLGLLCMALHPDMKKFPYVFLNYTYMKGSDLRSRWVRYTYDGKTLVTPLVLLEVPADIGHNGSRIAFAPDGTIMLATGDADHKNDAANSGNAQKLEIPSGKILRLNIDGTIPPDNPFPGSPVWALGFRVPQGLVYASNGKLYSAEHGNLINDEVNLIERGRNYGYPNVSGACDTPNEREYCESNNIKEPIAAWTPTIAPAGLDYYNHDAIPEWKNSLLLVTLKTQSLRVLKLNDAGDAVTGEQIYFENEYGRLRDVCVSPDGDVFLSTSNRDWNPVAGFPKENDDRIIRISRKVDVSRKQTASRSQPDQLRKSAPDQKGKESTPGAMLYANYCASCHKADGSGVMGTFPPLKGSPKVTAHKTDLIKVILNGVSGPLIVDGVKYDMEMPALNFLSDQEIADLVQYVRFTFGKKKEQVSVAEVARMRGK